MECVTFQFSQSDMRSDKRNKLFLTEVELVDFAEEAHLIVLQNETVGRFVEVWVENIMKSRKHPAKPPQFSRITSHKTSAKASTAFTFR
jgi:hypothetical protein